MTESLLFVEECRESIRLAAIPGKAKVMNAYHKRFKSKLEQKRLGDF